MAEPRTARQEILLPAKGSFIALSLGAALLVNLLPWAGAWRWVKPDFVALLLLYWCVAEPHRMGFAAAWLLGLAMDVAEGALLGQHALAYTLLAYSGIVLARRVRMFPQPLQVLHVIPLLIAADLVVLAVRAAAGAGFPGLRYFVGSLIAGLLWTPLGALLRIPQRPRPDPYHA